MSKDVGSSRGSDLKIRAAVVGDLVSITEIQNHYILNTHITFDLHAHTPEDRIPWFDEHNDGRRYRIVVAESLDVGILGYAATGRFRRKGAYDTTVEASIACSPQATGQGIGVRLYEHLFQSIQQEDIHRIVAGIAQPNPASNGLHARFGFNEVGTFSQCGRKFGRYWDVRWFERPLKLA